MNYENKEIIVTYKALLGKGLKGLSSTERIVLIELYNKWEYYNHQLGNETMYYTQAELGDNVDLSNVTLTRTLKSLQSKGYITYRSGFTKGYKTTFFKVNFKIEGLNLIFDDSVNVTIPEKKEKVKDTHISFNTVDDTPREETKEGFETDDIVMTMIQDRMNREGCTFDEALEKLALQYESINKVKDEIKSQWTNHHMDNISPIMEEQKPVPLTYEERMNDADNSVNILFDNKVTYGRLG